MSLTAPHHRRRMALPTNKACPPASSSLVEEAASEAPVTGDKDTWDEMWERLRAYKEQHGNTRVPKKYVPDPKLSQWARNQRTYYRQKQIGKYSFLTDERIEMLESLGFEWTRGELDTWTDRQAATFGAELLDATDQAKNAAFVIRECVDTVKQVSSGIDVLELHGTRDIEAVVVLETDEDLAKLAEEAASIFTDALPSRNLRSKSKKAQMEKKARFISAREKFEKILCDASARRREEQRKRLQADRDQIEAKWQAVANDLQHVALALEAGATALDLIHDVMKRSNVELFRRAGLHHTNVKAIRRKLMDQRKEVMFHFGGQKEDILPFPATAAEASEVKPKSYHLQKIEGYLTARSEQITAIKEKALKLQQQQKMKKNREQAQVGGEQAKQPPEEMVLTESSTLSFPVPRNGKEYTPIEVATILDKNKGTERWAILEEMRLRKLVPIIKNTAYKLLRKYQEGEPLNDCFGKRGRQPLSTKVGAHAEREKALEWFRDATASSLGPAGVEDLISPESGSAESTDSQMTKEGSNPPAEMIVIPAGKLSARHESDAKSSSARSKDAPPPPTPDELGFAPPRRGKYYSPKEVIDMFDGVRKGSTLRANIRKCLVFYGLVPVRNTGISKLLHKHKAGRELPGSWGRTGRKSPMSTDDLRALAVKVGGADLLTKEDIIKAIQSKDGKVPTLRTIKEYMAVAKKV